MDHSVHSDTTDEDVANITAMFPEYSADDIKLDLTLTRNASQTVNRILDGQLVCSGSSSFAAGSTLPALPGDSSDDDDLPDLTPILPLWQRLKQKQAEVPNLSTKITSQPINTKNTVKHPISTEMSNEEEPIKRLGSVSSVQETSASAQVSHQMSDSSDSDSFVTILPPIKKQKSNTESKSFMKSKFHQMSFEMSSDSDSSDNCLLKDLPLSQERKSEISKSRDETVSLPLTGKPNCVDMNEDVYSDNYAYSEQIDTQESQDCNSQHTEATTDGNTQETLDSLSTDDSSQLSTNISELSKKEQIQLKKEKALRIRQEKEMEREKKKQEREEKKREKELAADRKRIIADERRKAQPKECIKFVTVVIDSELMQRTSGSNLIAGLQEALIRFEIQKQAMPNLITFWREVTKVNDTGQKLIRESSEEVQDNILLCMPVSEFVVYTHTYQQLKQGLITEDSTTLTDYIIQTRQILENKNITLIVQGLEQHFRDLGAAKLRAAKAKTERGRNPAMLAHLINKVDVQEVLLDVQIQCGGGIVFVESDEEFTKTVKQFTKAIAEAPYKRSRQNTAFSFNVDRTSAVRLVNDSDHERLWRQQIQQFKGVGSEVANAIIAAYATPRTLWNAYMECGSQKQAESLLQDIVVRRGYGVLATERRVGKELSRRLYQVITAQQPNILLT